MLSPGGSGPPTKNPDHDRIGVPYNSHCQSRGGDGETLRHSLSNFSALAGAWLPTLVKLFFQDL